MVGSWKESRRSRSSQAEGSIDCVRCVARAALLEFGVRPDGGRTAETVRARMDDVTLNLKQAVWIWARLTLSRVKAYGAKWCKSYVVGHERLWQQSKSKVIPEEYRKYTLIEFGPQGDYYISSKLRKLFQETRDA